MWIYNQKKDLLIDTNVVYLRKIDGNVWAICTTSIPNYSSSYVVLGKYNNHAKALDVLKKLCNRIDDTESGVKSGVFQIPEDE